ncbi:MAG: asparagine synthase (glutamine-hydrolyzing) [bacterium]|nr:asparagine synthase (glutamine-hydrolyzing) [bacterium]
MCGIAGFVGAVVPGLMERMNAAQRHRGPDGDGLFADPEAAAALGHVRLAILDLSAAAAQPMHSPSRRFVLSYNGEIYNYRELRAELEATGTTLRSSGDTEVLLLGLERHGEDFLGRLNGMFALALWDRRERSLLLARDPLGIKPLYYAEPQPGTLLFASEIKALCAHRELRREPDFVALQQHLTFCHAAGDRTALQHVRRLPQGSLLRWRDGCYRVRSYWQPSFVPAAGRDRAAAARELRESVRQATLGQLVSDVPVAAFLSGGLDSSLISAVAAARLGSSLHAYTITYPSSENVLDRFVADTPYARTVAGALDLSLEEVEIRPEVASLWPDLVYHLDEPLADPAAIASYLISRLARERGTPVVLSGQGADELFGGYPRYGAIEATGLLDRLPALPRRALAAGARRLPGAWAGALGGTLRRVRRVLIEGHRAPEERFLAYCASTPPSEIHKILSPEVRHRLLGRRGEDSCLEHMHQRGLEGVNRFLERDLSVYLVNHNLLYTDKMGMAVGVEVRVPLLDQELVRRVTPLPVAWKLARGKTKVLLREAARGLVPDEIIHRRKAGFGAPYRKWLRHDLGELWSELTSERAVRERGWFDHRGLEDARRRSQEGKVDLYMLQWAVLTIELWARRFIDRNPAADIGAP